MNGRLTKKAINKPAGIWHVPVLAALLFSAFFTNKAQAISLPVDAAQRAFVGNTSISVGAAYQAYMSRDVQQRRLAEMYLLGVLDTTEGSLWCGYGIASPGAIQEQVYQALKAAVQHDAQARAATAVVQHYTRTMPCR